MAERSGFSSAQTFDDFPSTAGVEEPDNNDIGLYGETNILNLEGNQDSVGQSAKNEGYSTKNPEMDEAEAEVECDQSPEMEPSENPEDLEETELSQDGILDERTIERGLSNLGRTACGTQQVFLDLTLPGYCLNDICLLTSYVHIQKVELPYNELEDLSALQSMQFLIELDVSHNKISSLDDFINLTGVKSADFSYNQICEIKDLSRHQYLTILHLDNNQISEIAGLENCERLKELSIGHNQISTIEGLDYLPITKLNLEYNLISEVTGVDKLEFLMTINLSGNKMTSLRGLENRDFLEAIDVENNQIASFTDLDPVLDLRTIRDLNLKQNPILQLPDYRLNVLFRIQKLTELDRSKVDAEEKVAAINLFNPSKEVIAARDHIMHVVYSFLQPGKVMECTMLSMSTPYPMLVLVGPEGSGIDDLSMKLVAELPEYFGYGIMFTTRKPYAHEVADKHYNFVSLDEFEDEIRYGQFLFTYNYAGDWYGLTVEAVESVARDGLACVVHMELEGVFSLKNTHFEPRYVFIMPITPEAHAQRLKDAGIYQDAEIDLALSRAQIYIQKNVEYPGFFDMYINSDDLTEAYARLRRLVLDYLGVSQELPIDDAMTSQEPLANQDAVPPPSAGLAEVAKPWSQALSNKSTSGADSSPMLQQGGTLEEESIRRRQSAAREALFDCQRPWTHDLVINRATRSCMERIRTSADPAAAQDDYIDSSSGDSNDSTGRSDSSLQSGQVTSGQPTSGQPTSGQLTTGRSTSVNRPTIAQKHGSSSASLLNSALTPKNTPNASGNLNDSTIRSIEGSENGSAEHRPGSADQRPGSADQRPGSADRPESADEMPQSGDERPNYSAVPKSGSGRPGSEKHIVLPPISSPLPVH